jgi:two-component system, chemotaxis family, response regulator Rcp1
MDMNQRPVEVLLVEDSPADARLAREALFAGRVPKNISLVSDGAQAIDFVHRRGEYKHAPRPDLVLLDLNLPKRDGLEVLREIKIDPELRSITVIVLTTSQFSRDVNMAYELSANCYIVKPVDLEAFYHVMRGIEEFWMTLASLPTLGKDPASAASDDSEGAGNSSNDRAGSANAQFTRTAPCMRRGLPVSRSAGVQRSTSRASRTASR